MKQGKLGPIARFLTEDHARLDGLLRRSVHNPQVVDEAAFTEFRAGLLRHIAMEEKVLLPDARARTGAPLALKRQLRADHAALAVLMVPPPTHALIAKIQEVLLEHNPLEEGPDGLYAYCEQLAGSEAEALLARLQATPEVPLAPHLERPSVYEHIEELLAARRSPGA